MYTSCRIYTDAKDLCDLIIQNRNEVETLLRGVPGFQAYYLIRTSDGVTTITVCDDQPGVEESNRRAADWVKTHAMGLKNTTPKIIAGETAIAFTAGKAAVSV